MMDVIAIYPVALLPGKKYDAKAVNEMSFCNLFGNPTKWLESCTNREMNLNEFQTSNCPKPKAHKLPNETNR